MRRAPAGPGVVPRVRPRGPGPGRRTPWPRRASRAAAPVELETDPRLGRLGVHGDARDRRPHPEPGPGVRPVDQGDRRPTSSACCPKSFFDVLAAIHRVDWQRRRSRWRSCRTGASTPSSPGGRTTSTGTPTATSSSPASPTRSRGVPRTGRRPIRRPTLLWGDVRLGNVIFDDDRRPLAVLDWEMTGIGPPEHDLAWYFALDAIQHELFGRSVPGFLDRDAALRALRSAARPGAGGPRLVRDLRDGAQHRDHDPPERAAGAGRPAAVAPARRQPVPRHPRPTDRGVGSMTSSVTALDDLDIDPGTPGLLPAARLLRRARPAAGRGAGVRVRARDQGRHPLPRHPRDQPQPGDVLLRAAARSSTTRCARAARSTGRSCTWTRPSTAPGAARSTASSPRGRSNGWRTSIRALAVELLDAVPPGEVVDLVDVLAAPLPVLVICELLGVPDANRGDFRRWSDATILAYGRPGRAPAGRARRTSWSWSRSSSSSPRDKRANPADDVVSLLVGAEVDGRRLTAAELVTFNMSLLVAGQRDDPPPDLRRDDGAGRASRPARSCSPPTRA